MTRVTGKPPPYDVDVVIALICGPQGYDFSEEELERAWFAYRDQFDGPRIGGYWGFQHFEEDAA